MSDEQVMREPPKNRANEILIYFAVAVLAFGGGILLESEMAAKKAEAVAAAHDQDSKQAAAKAEQDKQVLADSLAKEREEHAKDNQARDRHLATVASNAAGMRHSLEAGLSAARSSGDACTSRINGISEALGGIFDSIGEVTGIAQDLGRENQQLKTDNKSLTEKLEGWQKWNTENSQRITIVGKKTN